MKYIETVNLNCDVNSVPSPSDSHVIRMDSNSYHAYCIFICVIGELYYTAQQLQSEGILNEPYKASIIIPKVEVFKNRQPEDNLTRIKFLLSKFVPPEKGISISFYEHWQEKKVQRPYGTFVVWPYEDQWNKDNCQEYVAVQKIDGIEDSINYPGIVETYERVLAELDILGIEYKLVGYHQKIEELYNTILNSKMLLSYTGCSYYIAGGMNLPTLAFGDRYTSLTDNYVMKKHSGRKTTVPTLFTAWGNQVLSNAKLVHYEKVNGLHNRPQSNTLNIGAVKTERDYEILRNELINGTLKE
jgi:hypothetical protein